MKNMNANILVAFTVFETPTKSYARVTGLVDAPDNTVVGSKLSLSDKRGNVLADLRVDFVSKIEPDGGFIFGLDGVVMTSRADAQAFCANLKEQTGLDYDSTDW